MGGEREAGGGGGDPQRPSPLVQVTGSGRSPRGLPCSWHRAEEMCRMAWPVWIPLPSCRVVGGHLALLFPTCELFPDLGVAFGEGCLLPLSILGLSITHPNSHSRVSSAAEHSGTKHHLPTPGCPLPLSGEEDKASPSKSVKIN